MLRIYFLRDIKTKSQYIHPTGEHMFQSVYGLKPGKVGACCFNEEQTEAFLANWDGEALEKEEITL